MDSTIIGAILQNAGVGAALMVVLIITGVLDPARNTKRAQDEAERWHKAWETSEEQNTVLRLAAGAQIARADSAVEAARRLAGILEGRDK